MYVGLWAGVDGNVSSLFDRSLFDESSWEYRRRVINEGVSIELARTDGLVLTVCRLVF